jgi:hypothetical protein
VAPVGVAVQVSGRNEIEVGLLEFLTRLEGLVEDRLRDQVAHLQADQGLAAARRGLRHLDVQAVIRRILELEVHLPLDLDRFQQSGHGTP